MLAGIHPLPKMKKLRQSGGSQPPHYNARNCCEILALTPAFNKNHQQRKCLISNLKKKDMKILKCLCADFLSGQIPADIATIQKLVPGQKTIETLAEKNTSLDETKKILQQKGGFLGRVFLPIVTKTILPAVVSKLLKI